MSVGSCLTFQLRSGHPLSNLRILEHFGFDHRLGRLGRPWSAGLMRRSGSSEARREIWRSSRAAYRTQWPGGVVMLVPLMLRAYRETEDEKYARLAVMIFNDHMAMVESNPRGYWDPWNFNPTKAGWFSAPPRFRPIGTRSLRLRPGCGGIHESGHFEKRHVRRSGFWKGSHWRGRRQMFRWDWSKHRRRRHMRATWGNGYGWLSASHSALVMNCSTMSWLGRRGKLTP